MIEYYEQLMQEEQEAADGCDSASVQADVSSGAEV